MLITSVNSSAQTLTVTRGAMGTTAASHALGTSIYIVGWPLEFTGQRIEHVLDDLTGASYPRDLDTGITYVQATKSLDGLNAMQHSFDVALSEPGSLFVAPDGKLTFHDRNYRLVTNYAPAVTIGDTPTDNIRWAECDGPKSGDTYIYNRISVQRDGGVVQMAEDAASQTSYGTRDYEEKGILADTDLSAQVRALSLLPRYKDPMLRIPSISFYPFGATRPYYLFNADIDSRVQVRVTPAGLLKQFYVDGVNHDWSASSPHAWRTTWQLSPADHQTYLVQASNTGYYYCHDAMYSAAHDATQTGVGDTHQYTAWLVGNSYPISDYQIERAGLVFPCALNPSLTLLAAYVFILPSSIDTAGGNFDLTLVSGADLGDTLNVWDYGDLLSATTPFGSINTADLRAGVGVEQWVVIPLNAAGLAAITMGVHVRFGVRHSGDIANSVPASQSRWSTDGTDTPEKAPYLMLLCA